MDERPNMLPPTLRDRQRYIAYKLIAQGKVEFPDLSNSIWHALLNFLGELGTSKAKIKIIKDVYDDEKKMGLIRCSHTEVENVRAALSLIQRIGDIPVILRVIGISGTIKAAKNKFFGERDLTAFA